jgi:hypothetical protein
MHRSSIILIVVAVLFLLRIALAPMIKRRRQQTNAKTTVSPSKRSVAPWQRKILTVVTFSRLNTKRFFRDRLALFFGILFPLIFLFVFGGIFGKSTNTVSFNVGLIDQSHSAYAQKFIAQAEAKKVLKVDTTITTLASAETKMARGQLDAAVVLPASFGVPVHGTPSGQLKVYYTTNGAQAGETLVSVVQAEFQGLNENFVHIPTPFTVVRN